MLNSDWNRDGEGKRDIRGRILRLLSAENSGGHPWDEESDEVFRKDLTIAERWIETFPVELDLTDKRVVEVGCGFGALCVVAARCGARHVLGVELEKADADKARSLVAENFPEVSNRVDFRDYASLESPATEGQFDVVLSQNCFEHYARPEEVLLRMAALLKPGGLLYAGFGPLWESPFGSHLWSICKLPWAHLWAGEQLIHEHNRVRAHDQRDSWKALGLNQVELPRFQRMFQQLDDCRLLYFCANQTILKRSWFLFMLLEIGKMLPFLERYLTISLFVIVQKGGTARVRDMASVAELRRKAASGQATGRVVVDPT